MQPQHAQEEAEARAAVSQAGACGPASVVAVLAKGRVRLTRAGRSFDAQLAIPGYDDPREGDLVLALEDDTGASYVVGVLKQPPRTALEEALATPPPAEASVRVHDKRGRLIFEYDPDGDCA